MPAWDIAKTCTRPPHHDPAHILILIEQNIVRADVNLEHRARAGMLKRLRNLGSPVQEILGRK